MNGLYTFLYALCRFGFFLWHPVFRVHGRENVPEGGALICCNHSGMADPLWVIFAMGRKNRMKIMAKVQLIRIPLLGPFLQWAGVFGVDRGNNDIGAIKTALRVLKEGQKLLLFPVPVEIRDATCPYVKRIHEIVSGAGQEGRRVIILGRRDHPEVEAIAGWCDNPVVVETPEELLDWLHHPETDRTQPLLMVSQTTNTQQLLKCSVNFLKKECTNPKIYDTICFATENRQKEAAALS